IDYKRCPHKSEGERLDDIARYGEDSYFYRSSWLAQFSRISTTGIILESTLSRCNHKPYGQGLFYAGFDIAGSVAENVIVIFNGNRFHRMYCWREKDPDLTGDQAIENFNLYPGITINADANGVGAPAVSRVRKAGFSINGICNQGTPINPDKFLNRGAELYTNAAGSIRKGILNDKFEDKVLREQLLSRTYRELVRGKMALTPKRLHPGPSPDRADAWVLCVDLVPDPPVEVEEKIIDPVDYFRRMPYTFNQSEQRPVSMLEHILYASKPS